MSESLAKDTPRLAIASGFLIVLLVAATLRYLRASTDDLMFDEQWHVELATGRGSMQDDLPRDRLIENAPPLTSLNGAAPWHEVWTHMTGVVHPPLYCQSLRLWMNAFGVGDMPVKWFSITCDLIAIALLFEAVRESSGSSAALWTALIFALAPAQVYFGQMVRGYSMAQMWGCGLLAAIIRIERRGANPARCVAACLWALALPLSHYFGIFTDVAIGIYVLIRLRGRVRRDTVIALLAAAAIFLLVWGKFMWAQRREVAATADTFLVETDVHGPARIARVLLRAAAAPTWQFLGLPNQSVPWASVGGGILLIACIVIFRRREQRIWLVWIAGTLIAVMMLDLFRSTRQLVFPRYVSLAAPAIFAMIVIAFFQIKSAMRHAGPALIALIALGATTTAYTLANRSGEPPGWESLGDAVRQEFPQVASPDSSNEAIVFYSGSQPKWFAGLLYLGASRYGDDRFPRPIVILSKPADDALIASLPGRSALLISGSSPYEESPERILPGTTPVRQRVCGNLATVTRVALPARAGGV